MLRGQKQLGCLAVGPCRPQQRLRQVYVIYRQQVYHFVFKLEVLWTAVMLYERGTCTVSTVTVAAAGTEKNIRDLKFVA